ncbi:MAG: helix-turn-helix domain-containing protein [Actinomycetota bacterium]|nr:helix-turn-helix domain-containing protein [Actinomycetota bacterium]
MKDTTETREIVEKFLERLDEVVDGSSVAIWDDVESYTRLGSDFEQDVRSAVRENVAILAHVLGVGKDVGRADLEPIERVGARRAEAGIPLEDVLHAYRIVSRVCWEVLAEECRAFKGDALDATIDIAEAVLRYTDHINTRVADAYARAQRAIVREQEGARREFLADLLYGTDASPDDILRKAHAFGYDLSLSYVALVGTCTSTVEGREMEVAAAATRAAELASTDPIVLQKAEHTIALIPSGPSVDLATMPEKLVSDLDGPWDFGMGGPGPGLEGIRKAYLEAREALEIGMALGLDGPIYRFDDLLLYHFLRIEPALVERFVDQMLGEVVAYDDRRKGELIKTVDAYFSADGSVKMAGEALFAHPHTVTYRLKQIEKLTGWSLRDPEDKIRLQLALRAYKLAQARNDADIL